MLNFDSYVQPMNSFEENDHLINLFYYLVTKGILFPSLVKRINWDTVPTPMLPANMTNAWLKDINATFIQHTHLGTGELWSTGPSLTSEPRFTPLQKNSNGLQFLLGSQGCLGVGKVMSTKCFKFWKERHYESITHT